MSVSQQCFQVRLLNYYYSSRLQRSFMISKAFEVSWLLSNHASDQRLSMCVHKIHNFKLPLTTGIPNSKWMSRIGKNGPNVEAINDWFILKLARYWSSEIYAIRMKEWKYRMPGRSSILLLVVLGKLWKSGIQLAFTSMHGISALICCSNWNSIDTNNLFECFPD